MASLGEILDFSDMNVGPRERIASLVGGGLLVAAALGRRPGLVGGAMLAAGGLLLTRAVTGHCGMKTVLEERKVEAARRSDVDWASPNGSATRPWHDHWDERDEPDLTGSFPASDPPSFTPGFA